MQFVINFNLYNDNVEVRYHFNETVLLICTYKYLPIYVLYKTWVRSIDSLTQLSLIRNYLATN